MEVNAVNHKIRIELCPKRSNSKTPWQKLQKRFIQGEPYDIYFRVTNIGSAPTPEFTISNFKLHSKSDSTFIDSKNTILIKQLNPNETIGITLDKMTIAFKGGAWAKIDVSPVNPELRITTFQHDSLHKKDEAYDNGRWGNLIYVQGELEVTQEKTNTLILTLTTVTVIESIFGMKKTLLALVELAYYPISQLAALMGSFIK
ncbi:hypothetical protein [Pseudomonas sp. S5D5]|uniref:hypothetical protein n=1 Tax=Pseudomonas sp. S5D5 TaxID=2083056 RepID=UPI001300B052|nr:hypothetical protein [Pseudomonas sp. S5D5]